MLTLETCSVSFIPVAGKFVVSLQTKGIVADVGNVEAKSAIDFPFVDRAKPFFEFYIMPNAEFHVFGTPPTIFCRLHSAGRCLQHFHPARLQQIPALNNSTFAYHSAATLLLWKT